MMTTDRRVTYERIMDTPSNEREGFALRLLHQLVGLLAYWVGGNRSTSDTCLLPTSYNIGSAFPYVSCALAHTSSRSSESKSVPSCATALDPMTAPRRQATSVSQP